ncbi:MAG: hypothetical protein MUC58_04050 [Rhizobiaceae bacterium]|nr:hypothetical protein [Rhizobiaceae bacterium]
MTGMTIRQATPSVSISVEALCIAVLLALYTLMFGPAAFAQLSNSAFMDIDPQSIMDSIDGLTSSPYYNMNAQYHSQFYGWTYFALHFPIVMALKASGLATEVTLNLTARVVLFVIGALLVHQMFRLARRFFSLPWAAFGTFAFMANPVASHFFITIHPESLGVLLQIVALRFFIAVYDAPGLDRRAYMLAVLFLSLSALCKQAFVIANGLIFIGFALAQWKRPGGSGVASAAMLRQLAALTVGIAFLVLMVIHPNVVLEFDRFLHAQLALMNEHAAPPFSDVAMRWAGVLSSNPMVLFALLATLVVPFLPRPDFPFKLSLVLTALALSVFIYQARLFVVATYLYPAFAFVFFNVFYIVTSRVMPVLKAGFGTPAARGVAAMAIAPALVVICSNAVFSTYRAHSMLLLDGLTTAHLAWNHMAAKPAGTKIAYSPNVAVLDPLKQSGCHAWQGCANAAALSDFDPDYVVFSPDYAHFDATSYQAFIAEKGYRLETEFRLGERRIPPCGGGPVVNLVESTSRAVVDAVAFYRVNIGSCLAAYGQAVLAWRDQTTISGLRIQIYARP